MRLASPPPALAAGCLGGLLILMIGTAAAAEPRQARQPRPSELLLPTDARAKEVRARMRAMSTWQPAARKDESWLADYKPKDLEILRYTTGFEFRERPMVFKFRAPGKGKTWASIEVKF